MNSIIISIVLISIFLLFHIILKILWVQNNIEIISFIIKKYLLSIVSVEEKRLYKYIETEEETCKLAKMTYLTYLIQEKNKSEKEMVKEYEQYQKELVQDFSLKIEKKIALLNKNRPLFVDEYHKIIQKPIWLIYLSSIFGNSNKFDTFIDKRYLETLKEKTLKNKEILDGTT